MSISRKDLLDLAKEKILDAQALHRAKRYDGAAYVCGYSVELFLKYRLCKQLKWAEFPSTRKEFESLTSLKTHDLQILLRFSGIERMVRRRHFAEWSIVNNWSPENRYAAMGKVKEVDSDAMIKAATVLIGMV